MAKPADMPEPGELAGADRLEVLESKVTALLSVNVPDYGDREGLEMALSDLARNYHKLSATSLELNSLRIRVGTRATQLKESYDAQASKLLATDADIQKGKNAEARAALVRCKLAELADETEEVERSLTQIRGTVSLVDVGLSHLRFVKDTVLAKVSLYKTDAALAS